MIAATMAITMPQWTSEQPVSFATAVGILIDALARMFFDASAP